MFTQIIERDKKIYCLDMPRSKLYGFKKKNNKKLICSLHRPDKCKRISC